MLPKDYRLKEKKDFRKVYQKGKSLAYPYFVLYSYPNRGRGTKIGFSVSKKVGKAVKRNLIKRRFREVCRHDLTLFSLDRSYIFIIRKAALDADYLALADQIKQAVKRS